MAQPGGPADLVAAVVHDGRAALVGSDVRVVGSVAEVASEMARLEGSSRPRWVWWSVRYAGELVAAVRSPLSRGWDLAEAHRILHGGWKAEPGRVWAGAHGIPLSSMPTPAAGDLFDFSAGDGIGPDDLVRPDGHLRAGAASGWLESDERLLRWAAAAHECAVRQREHAESVGPRIVGTVHSESAAALLCLELERGGLPVNRPVMEALIAEFAGPRAATEEEASAARRTRDAEVLRHVPGREGTDLRNPQQVRDMLAGVGVDVPNTRKWVLDAYRQTHPVVDALLTWRKAERIATTYGYRWLDECVGTDDRLRGGWTACDGAAGRMTAENGLHNLPAALRSGVAAHPEHVFVRADLGQIEPRVLAVVSGDPVFAEATRADDLYAPVAARLGVDRPIAKVAVLAAMYGQRSGAAGEALKGLERAYPVAMGLLDRAYETGVRGEPLRTFGGRLIPTGRFLAQSPVGTNPALDAARGRFARNAIIQGAAAELFKAWAATVRALAAPLGAQIVLCLHDELLVHAPASRAPEVAALVDQAFADASRRWAAGAPVRFVADTSIIERWSDAKD
ncbi:DNA polymerase I [Knoellia sinensis KCTC 19936]|uniref:DNA-directed DNA polymerase n=1 Tax=Knoellia sinensis KCTC 19936 TaxID=1385520 RepID=A0A0A0IXC4_9MICO|nr:DNA polymerase [Knoellia sinensis]KGN29870.1 DNA polymerase I [Knoellia sinensis KCTC 19936]